MKNRNLASNLFTRQKLTIKETSLSAQIKEFLDLHRIYNDRLNSGKVEIVKKYWSKAGWKEYRNWLHLCAEGTPDRFFIIEGYIVFVEVKQKGKKPTDVQLAKHEELRTRAKAFVLLVDSFEAFECEFKRIRQLITSKS